MEESKSEQKSSASTIALSIGVIFLALYFLCPAVFVLPLIAVYKARAGSLPPAAVQRAFVVFFAPISALEDRFPAYHAFLQEEAKLFGVRD